MLCPTSHHTGANAMKSRIDAGEYDLRFYWLLIAALVFGGLCFFLSAAHAADGASGGWGPSGPPASGGDPKNTFDTGGGGTPTGGQSGCNCLGGGGGYGGRG